MTESMNRRNFLRAGLMSGVSGSLLLTGRARDFSLFSAPESREPFHGSFPIVQTPFDMDGKIIFPDLAGEADYMVRGGTHGMVWPQLASEVMDLTEPERMQGAETLAEANRNRAVFVLGVQGPDLATTLRYTQHANSVKPDAVIAMPPWGSTPSVEEIKEYYHAIASNTSLPVFIQNGRGQWGSGMTIDLMLEMARRDGNIDYIKEELQPVPQHITEFHKKNNGTMKGIFSGSAGRYLLFELDRGAAGTMASAGMVDLYAQVFDWYTGGRKAEAEGLFLKMQPLIGMEGLYGVHFTKELLKRRGVFQTNHCRREYTRMDEADLLEITKLWTVVAPYARV